MATVASLAVKLGLDSKKFDSGVKKSVRGLDRLVARLDRLNGLGKFTAITAGASALTSLTAAAWPATGAILALPAAALVASAGVATLATGLSGVGEAMAATGGTSEELQKALDKLAPSAQKFVRSFAGVRERFKPIQQAVQQKLFAGLGKELSELATGTMPTLRTGMTQVASALNSLGSEALTTMNTPLFKGQMADIFDGTAKATKSFKGVVGPLLTVLAQLAIAGLPLINRFNEWASGALGSAAAFLTSEAGAAKMSNVVERAGDVMAQLSSIAKNLGSFLGGIFSGASVSGGDLLTTVENLTGQWAEWVNSAEGQEKLGEIFSTLNQIAGDLVAILPGIASVISTIASVFTSLPGPVQSTVTQMLAWSMVLGAVAGKLTPLYTGLKMLAPLASKAGGPLAKLGGTLLKLGGKALIMGAKMLAGWIMGMGPIGWIIAAIVALVALVIIYWDQIVAAIKAAWQWVKQITVAAWESIKAWLVTAWESIKSAISTAVQFILNWLKNNWMLLLGILTGPIGLAVGLIIKYWDQIKAGASAAWNWIKSKVSALVQAVVSFIMKRFLLAKRQIQMAWTKAKVLTKRAWSAIKSAVTGGVSTLVDKVKSIPGKIKDAFSSAKNFLLDAGKNIISGLIDGVTSKISALKDKFSGVTDMIPDWKGPARIDAQLLNDNGEMIMGSLAEGIEGALPGLRSTLQGVTREIPSNVNGSVRHTGGQQERVVIDVTGADEDMKRLIRRMVRTEGRGDVQTAFGRR